MTRKPPPDPAETLKYFEGNAGVLLELLRDLTGRDAPSGDAEASRRFASHYRALLEECGVACREFVTAAGVHLAGDWPGDAAGPGVGPDVVLVLHSDTVWPLGESTRRPPAVRDGKLYGPGVYDMRAGLALAVALFRYLRDRGAGAGRRLRLFVSADEELGSVDARQFMAAEVPRDAVAMIPEPPLPDGGLKIFRKGVGIYTIEITGRAAHAGVEPETGASAIDELARQIFALHALRDPARGITVNIGEVEGGTASNVVADHARCSIDLRFEKADDGELLDWKIHSLAAQTPGVVVKVKGGIIFPPMVPDARARRVVDRAVEIAARLGIALSTGSSGGGSDGSFLASRGVRTLDGLGVEGGGAHSLDEHILIDRLPPRAALFAQLALEIPG